MPRHAHPVAAAPWLAIDDIICCGSCVTAAMTPDDIETLPPG
jgi:hypothetical protein